MGSFSLWHWLVVLAVVLILFGGGGKISKIMADMGKGVKGFKKGLKEESEGDSSSSSPTALSSSGQGAASDSSARKDETVKT